MDSPGVMTGLRGTAHRDSLLQWFAPITRLPFNSAWWQQTWDMAARPWKKRISPKVADCFIATIATNHRVCLIHCDGDFETIKPAVSLQTPDWTAHLRR
jgi:predicted nucleic acid-binding protein